MNKIGQCCKNCYDGENAYPEHCSCLCHENTKAVKLSLLEEEEIMRAVQGKKYNPLEDPGLDWE